LKKRICKTGKISKTLFSSKQSTEWLKNLDSKNDTVVSKIQFPKKGKKGSEEHTD
jgi:hypothetical protein